MSTRQPRGALPVAVSVKAAAFRQPHRECVEDIAGHLHRALLPAKGAPVTAAEVRGGIGRFCGVANIAARLAATELRNLINQFPTAGYQTPKIRTRDQACEDGAVLVIHSDGSSPREDLDQQCALVGHHLQRATAPVVRDAPQASGDALVPALGGLRETTAPQTAEAR